MKAITNKRKLSTNLPEESNDHDENSISGDSNNMITTSLMVCHKCEGEGRVRARRTKKASMIYKREIQAAEQSQQQKPIPPPPRFQPCKLCNGTGLFLYNSIDSNPILNNGSNVVGKHQNVAIIGGGIGGLALALSLQHRNINVTVYERDLSVDQRLQGYGLTMQQGTKALKSLGFFSATSESNNSSDGFGIKSKQHFVFDQYGTQIAQWGLNVWGRPGTKKKPANRQNVHIPRQRLRKLLLNKLKPGTVKWGYKLVDYTESNTDMNANIINTEQKIGTEKINGKNRNSISNIKNKRNEKIKIEFEYMNEKGISTKQHHTSSILVGADGIRSVVRQIKIGESTTPLNYLGCIVILGIVESPDSKLTDGETVFQTADGTTRLYAMPFSPPDNDFKSDDYPNCTIDSSPLSMQCNSNCTSKSKSMWQLSFPMTEEDAKTLSARGPAALKTKALERCGKWHDPIPTLLQSTPERLISGYPVYDRDLLSPEQIRSLPKKNGISSSTSTTSTTAATNVTEHKASNIKTDFYSRVTLLGDAAHPMSPFKGQGANQALLDAVSLSRCLYKAFLSEMKHRSNENNVNAYDESKVRIENVVPNELAAYETRMLEQSGKKVKASAYAAKVLHSDVVLKKGNVTRGSRSLMNNDTDNEDNENEKRL